MIGGAKEAGRKKVRRVGANTAEIEFKGEDEEQHWMVW